MGGVGEDVHRYVETDAPISDSCADLFPDHKDVPVGVVLDGGGDVSAGAGWGISGDGTTAIAVEVDTRARASHREYERAMRAHTENPAIRAVWVLLGAETALPKVRRAAADTVSENPLARIRVAHTAHENGHYRAVLDTDMKRDIMALERRRVA